MHAALLLLALAADSTMECGSRDYIQHHSDWFQVRAVLRKPGTHTYWVLGVEKGTCYRVVGEDGEALSHEAFYTYQLVAYEYTVGKSWWPLVYSQDISYEPAPYDSKLWRGFPRR